MALNLTGYSLADARMQIAASLPAQRYGQPEDSADVIAILMSVLPKSVTGRMTCVDVGMINNF